MKRNTNTLEERQTHSPKSYAATINDNNMTMNDDISDFNGLIFEINPPGSPPFKLTNLNN